MELYVIIGEHKEKLQLAITELGDDDLFLGYDWLQHHNPTIDWITSEIQFNHCPPSCRQKLVSPHLEGMNTWTEYSTWKKEENLRRSSVAMDLAIEQEKKKETGFDDIQPFWTRQ